jgi:hypothetical protein
MSDQLIIHDIDAHVEKLIMISEMHRARITALESSIVKLFNLIRYTQRAVNTQISMLDDETA